MKTVEQYLDDAKALTGSDRQTALRIGVKPQYISQTRGGEPFSDDAGLNLAELLGIDPMEILAAINVRRTKKPEMKAKWEELGKKVSSYAASVFFGIPALLHVLYDPGLYIM